MSFEQYILNNFKVGSNGELRTIRKKCFNGNEKLMPITYDCLEELWDCQQQKIDELEALLIKAAKVTYQCQELHDWYCENKENE